MKDESERLDRGQGSMSSLDCGFGLWPSLVKDMQGLVLES